MSAPVEPWEATLSHRLAPRRIATLLACVGLAATALTGCGTSTSAGGDLGRIDVPTTADAESSFVEQGAWWAQGMLHLGDRQLEVGRLRSFAVADHTVAYVSEGGRLCFTDLTTSECSDFRPRDDLVVSPDGDHLGFLDGGLGPTDEYDTSLLTSTVVELSSGQVLASSTRGMGDVDADDLADLYEETWPHVAGFDDSGEALVWGADGEPFALPLDGSDPRGLPYEPGDSVLPDQIARDVPGETVLIRRRDGGVQVGSGTPTNTGVEGRLSPDGQALVLSTPNDMSDLRVSDAPSGTPVRLTGQQDPWWSFGDWSGPHEFLAITLDARQTTYGLYRCDAAEHTCSLEQDVPAGDLGYDGVIFPTATGSDTSSIGDY